ncbi:hypothetical protein FRB95_008543 [Tulasnella sp. JGI-2019a]|nr:hypothetical protein FRB95_008543 [Tulasnella sp. JGI-2019a]
MEAEALVKEILLEQKDILAQYVGLLHTDAIEPFVTSNHLGTRNVPDNPAQLKDHELADASPKNIDNGPDKAIPSTFPIIRPVRAARYFEEQAAELGDWPIYISTRAFRHLWQLDGGDAAILGIVRKKIKVITWSLLRLESESPNKCEDGSESKYEKQQLRLYGIFTHAQLDKRLWASVAAQSQKRGSEYRRRCVWHEVAKNKSKGVNVTPPAISPPRSEGEERVGDISGQATLGDADYLELHDILALEKFIPYSHTLLDTIRGNEDVAHVFDVSSKEDEIIYHNSSCLVVGRSGTGKTTTMLFKMIALERAAQHSDTKIRQIFVTQSRVLAGRVEEYFKKLVLTSQSTKPTTALPTEESQIATKPQQELLDLDDEVDDDERLPSRWSDLQDHHFPLFLTFDQLCRLLEGDCDLTYHRDSLTRTQRSIHSRYTLKSVTDTALDLDSLDTEDLTVPAMKVAALKSRKEGLLTFERFQATIWPHFDVGLVKGLDPAPVFSEFMGVIQGCEESLATPYGYIDRSAYENMSARMQSTLLDHDQRYTACSRCT